MSLISVVQSGINVFWAPFVYKNYSKYPEYLSAGHDIIAFAMTVFGLGVILAQDFIYLAIGPNYHGSQSFFPITLVCPRVFHDLRNDRSRNSIFRRKPI